jgi:TorA maturation chaperone TorD
VVVPVSTDGHRGHRHDEQASYLVPRLGTGTAVALASLLSHWWSRPVPAEVTGWPGAAELADLEAHVGTRGVANTAVLAMKSGGASLLDEYERLFVGPGPVPCPPYESFWREDVPLEVRRSLMGPCTAELRLIYGELGLEMAATSGEMPDHVAVELEALAFALSSTPTWPVAGAIWSDHLRRWLPRLCRAVAREAEAPFYRDLAPLTIDWSGLLQRHLEMLGGRAPEAG